MALTNILVLGDSGTGKTAWLKEKISAGEGNYVIVDLYGEYKEVRKALLQKGYTIHAFCLAENAVLYQEMLHDLLKKEKQALFLNAPQDAYADAALARACIQTIMDAASALPEKKQSVLCCLDDAAMLGKLPGLAEQLPQLSANGMYMALAFQKIWQVYELYGKTLLVSECFPTVIYTGGTDVDAQEFITDHYSIDKRIFLLKEDQMLVCIKKSASVQSKKKKSYEK